MKHFDPNTFSTDLSHNLNNVNPEAGEVNTLSDKIVKVFNDTLDNMHHIVTHPEKNNAHSTNHGSPKAF